MGAGALSLSLSLSPLLRCLLYSRIRTPNDPERIDSIVVLGTVQYDGRPSRHFAARLRHAAELWHEHGTQRVYTLGGRLPGDRFTEAEVGRCQLIEAGVDAALITASATGNDTDSSFAALDPDQLGRTLVVTDPTHSYRAVRIARRRGVDAHPSPTPHTPGRVASRRFLRAVLHECGGIVVADVSTLVGAHAADRVEDVLRSLQARFRPSRRARHEQLRRLRK